MVYLAVATAWISTSTAVIYAIKFTGSLMPLWALIIPSLISARSDNKDKE